MKLRDISETFEQDLQDPEFVQWYLEDALDDGIPTFLIALRNVIKAQKAMSPVRDDSAFGSETIEQTLFENGNPRLETITKVLTALGLKISISQINLNRAY